MKLNTILKIATLNLCLGLKFKKDLVKNILYGNEIDVLLIQETEIEKDFDCVLLNIPGYKLELEVNDTKSRVGTYIKNSIKYERCTELEGVNKHLVIVDVLNGKKPKKRIINIYRSFNPQGTSQREHFSCQLDLIKLAFNRDSVLIGDLNLDYATKFNVNYQRETLFELFDTKLGALNLIQIVNFDTWSRMVGPVLRSSILDHIYVTDNNYLSNVTHVKPCFGDHVLIMADCCTDRPENKA